jgi:RIO kinase 1
MKKNDYYETFDFFEDLEDLDPLPIIKNTPTAMYRHKYKVGKSKLKKPPIDLVDKLTEVGEDRNTFEFSYHASLYEAGWLVDSLGIFYEQHWIDDVLRLIKGGKEASVYQCLANPLTAGGKHTFLAAKVYRPRQFRSLKNDHLYRENRANLDSDGNVIGDDGKQHAIRKKTEFGLELLHTSWLEHEYKTMQLLKQVGADTPIPFICEDNAILMEYIGNEDMAAPTLNTISLSTREARSLFQRVVHNVELMLSVGRVHADLSAYNILYWQGDITLIDFPQAISPQENRNAYQIFERDILRVCDYFIRQGVRSDPRQLSARLWTSFRYPVQPDIHPGLLDAEDDKDRVYWQQYGHHDN